MNPASLLMIHNAWTSASGNAKELRKAADDLETISSAAAETYRAKVNLSDEELATLLDNETWITPADAVAWGFATEVLEEEQVENPSQSARTAVYRALTQKPVWAVDGGVIMTGTISASDLFPQSPKQDEKTLSTFLSALSKGGKE